MARPFAVIGFTLFFVSAVQLTLGVPAAAELMIAAACAVAGLAVLCLPRLRQRKLPAVVLFAAAGAAFLLFATQTLRVQPAQAFDGQRAEIEALLTEEPEEKNGKQYFPARILTVNEAPVNLTVRLTLPAGTGAQPFDRVRAQATFYLPGDGDEDRLSSFRSQGVFLAAYTNKTGVAVLPRAAHTHRIGMAVLALRAWLRSTICQMLPNRYGCIARAMILGEREALPDADYAAFRQAGMLHLLCVSGLHLSVWTMSLYRFLRRARVPRQLCAVLGMLWTLLFMAITGFTYSVVRAGMMLLLFLAAELTLRDRDALNSLGVALTVLVLAQPYCVLHIGLLLSALSTLGLILEQQFVAPALRRIGGAGWRRPLRYVAETICMTGAVFVFTLPVMLYVYGGVNAAMFLSNFLASPVAGPAIMLTVSGGAMFAGGWPLPNLPGLSGGLCIKWISFVARAVSALPQLSVCLSRTASCLLLAIFFLLLAAALVLAAGSKRLQRFSAVLLCAVLLLGGAGAAVADRRETQLRVLDVGNGTAVLLSCRGRNYLIGAGGTDPAGVSELRQAVQRRGGRLRAMVLPGLNEAESAYALEIAGSFRPETLLCDAVPFGFELLGLRQRRLSDGYTDGVVRLTPMKAGAAPAVLAETPALSALICFAPAAAMPAAAAGAQVLIVRGDYPADTLPESLQFVAVNAENQRGMLLQTELLSRGMPAAATAGCGALLIRAADGAVSAGRDE